MKREEAVLTDNQVKQYLEKHKIRARMSELTKELLLKQPDDPISYLIAYLEKRTKRQILCIHSFDEEARTRIANIVANKYNFKLIDMNQIFKDIDYYSLENEQINKKVGEELKKTETVYKGIIISGYPNNFVQLDYIQKCGILPDRYFILPSDEAHIAQQYAKKYSPEETALLLERNKLQTKEIVENLGQLLDWLPSNTDKAGEKLIATLNIKAKKQIPYESLRILAIHPPYLIPETLQHLTNTYSLHQVSVQKALKKLCEKKGFNEFVEKNIRRNGYISKQIQLALLQTQCRSASAKSKGYLLNGWPKKKQSLAFLKENFLNPHIIFVFDLDEEEAVEKFKKVEESNHNLFAVCKKPEIEEYRKEFGEYKRVVEQIKSRQKTQLIRWSETQKQVQKTFESMVENGKIYS